MTEWERCNNWLQAALDAAGNLATLEQVKALVDEGKARFWPGKECAFVTEIVQYPNKRALNIWLAGGDLQEMLSFEPMVRAYAKDKGCDLLVIQGRPGWQKVFKKTPKWIGLVDEV